MFKIFLFFYIIGSLYRVLQIFKIYFDISFLITYKNKLISLNNNINDKPNEDLDFLEINLYRCLKILKIKSLYPKTENLLLPTLLKNFYFVVCNQSEISLSHYKLFSTSVVSDINSTIGELTYTKKIFFINLFPIFCFSNFIDMIVDFLFFSLSFNKNSFRFNSFISSLANICNIMSFYFLIDPQGISKFNKIFTLFFEFIFNLFSK